MVFAKPVRTVLKWKDNRRGNIAMSFALTITPLLLMVGFAVDYSRTQSSSDQVQFALDGAVLAAAVELQTSNSSKDIQAVGKKYFDASRQANKVSSACSAPVFTPNFVDHKVTASVKCKQSTTLSGLLGVSEIDFMRTAETVYGVGKLDVAFMFDTSGSMQGSRMTDLKNAAKEAVKTILASKTKDPNDVRIAISTYATSVNVGTTYFKKVTNQEPNSSKCTKWKKKKGKWKCKKWKQVSSTCVTGREGSQKYTDAKPGSNAWIEYDTLSCNSATITPLTNNKTTLDTAINGLPTSGSTAGHLGIVWSWYLISPEWNSIWPTASAPKPYDEPDLTKVAILMTDGEFNNDYMSNGNSFDHAKKYCDAMKAKKIQIYTVAFKAPKQGQDILSYCASSTENAFKASSGKELTEAYQKIATQISDLRLAK